MFKKLIACLFLLVFHVSICFKDLLPSDLFLLLNILGCLALPLFAHALATGFLNTRHSGYYFIRLSICAVLTQLILVIILPMAGISFLQIPLNVLYTLLLAFGVLYGIEIMVPYTPDRIGSLRLLEANAKTKSDRYDVRICDPSSIKRPPGLRVPKWPRSVLQLTGLVLVVLCITLPVILSIDYGIIVILTVLLFYSIEKWISKAKLLTALLCYLLILLAYLLLYYRMSGAIHPVSFSFLSVFICYVPLRQKRPSRAVQMAFYVFFPLHLLILALIHTFFFS